MKFPPNIFVSFEHPDQIEKIVDSRGTSRGGSNQTQVATPIGPLKEPRRSRVNLFLILVEQRLNCLLDAIGVGQCRQREIVVTVDLEFNCCDVQYQPVSPLEVLRPVTSLIWTARRTLPSRES